MYIEKYQNWIQRIHDFNGVMCGNNHTFENRRIELQKKLTLEEIDETIDAVKADDVTEILDGVADVLVTGSYYYFLIEKMVPKEIPNFTFLAGNYTEVNLADVMYELTKIKTQVELYRFSHYDMQNIIVMVGSIYGFDRLYAYIEAVLSSNESKFIPANDFDEETELKYMNEQYADTEYTNIQPVERMFGDQSVICMKADGGQGKMLKPSCYNKPQYYL